MLIGREKKSNTLPIASSSALIVGKCAVYTLHVTNRIMSCVAVIVLVAIAIIIIVVLIKKRRNKKQAFPVLSSTTAPVNFHKGKDETIENVIYSKSSDAVTVT